MAPEHNVFVYGTLKRGEPNHHWLTKPENGNGKFVSKAQTTLKYPLIIATKYNIPFLLHHPGSGHHVKGEIFMIDNKMLASLDSLEDHPNFYVREIRSLQMLGEDGKPNGELDCWVYFLMTFRPSLLELPAFEDYANDGNHGLKYGERSQRAPNYSAIQDQQRVHNRRLGRIPIG